MKPLVIRGSDPAQRVYLEEHPIGLRLFVAMWGGGAQHCLTRREAYRLHARLGVWLREQRKRMRR